MKFSPFLVVLAFFASVLTSLAQTSIPAYGEFSGQGVNVTNGVEDITFGVATANGYAPPAPPGGLTGPGPAVLDAIQVTGDKATTVLVFNKCGTPVAQLQPTNTAFATATTTNFLLTPDGSLTNAVAPITLAQSNSITAGTKVLVRHFLTDTYERNQILSVTLTNVIFKYALLTMPATGDAIYPLTSNGSILVGVNTTTYQSYGAAGGVANGVTGGLPFEFETQSSGTNSTINYYSGHYPAR